ncbi:hypothetical protein [Salinibius halmophilus]|uniref:hypothetical protein n=1 Tax=Salinibius halmophilus TaxID=1853216 RepID=UPI000E66B735|nr:hypothetical protein [Salinibius halmophilus]
MSQEQELERLYEFLYVAPVALVEFGQDGTIRMANPRLAQVFNRISMGAYFPNFFDFLDKYIPSLLAVIKAFDADNGEIQENVRYSVDVPAEQGSERLWFDITVARQEQDRYFASLNNVTQQMKLAEQNHYRDQWLSAITNHLQHHVFFTIDAVGIVDSWNRTGEVVLGTISTHAIGMSLLEIVECDANELEKCMSLAAKRGVASFSATMTDRHHQRVSGQINLQSILDMKGDLQGYSVVLSLS